jgi:hypothetical protein
MRHAYIAGKMKKAGAPDAKIVGSGRDWYVFNPGTNQWVGVTNDPDGIAPTWWRAPLKYLASLVQLLAALVEQLLELARLCLSLAPLVARLWAAAR